MSSKTPQAHQQQGFMPATGIYPGKTHRLELGASEQPCALGTETTLVRILASEDCYLWFGEMKKDSLGMPFGKNQPEIFAVNQGDTIWVKGSGGGIIFVTEGA